MSPLAAVDLVGTRLAAAVEVGEGWGLDGPFLTVALGSAPLAQAEASNEIASNRTVSSRHAPT
jgi:hypothetical protein